METSFPSHQSTRNLDSDVTVLQSKLLPQLGQSFFLYLINADKWVEFKIPNNLPKAIYPVVHKENLIFVHWTRNEMRSMDFLLFDSTVNEYKKTTCFLPHRRYFRCVVLDDYLYFIGGSDKFNEPFKETHRLDLKTNRWMTIASPNVHRFWPRVCAVRGSLYLFGGFLRKDSRMETMIMERYCPRLDLWEIFNFVPVKFPVRFTCAPCLEKIYIKTDEELIVFDTQEKNWTNLWKDWSKMVDLRKAVLCHSCQELPFVVFCVKNQLVKVDPSIKRVEFLTNRVVTKSFYVT